MGSTDGYQVIAREMAAATCLVVGQQRDGGFEASAACQRHSVRPRGACLHLFGRRARPWAQTTPTVPTTRVNYPKSPLRNLVQRELRTKEGATRPGNRFGKLLDVIEIDRCLQPRALSRSQRCGNGFRYAPAGGRLKVVILDRSPHA